VARVAANLHFLFGEHGFLDRFAAARRAGFQAVEFPDPYSYPRDELRSRLQDNGLGCVLLNFPMGDRAAGDMGIACLPRRRSEFRESVPRAIETALALGCPRLNCMAGRRPPDEDASLVRATLVENLRFAAAACGDAGLEVTLEPLNTVDYPDIFVNGTQQAVALIREAGADNVQLQFDCYHMEIMEGLLAERLEQLLPVIGHIQIADVPGRHEPGSGRIDYPRLFALLDGLGYAGWVGAEYRPSTRTEDTLGWRSPDRTTADSSA
jgi:hydroxypyruvate isomerase